MEVNKKVPDIRFKGFDEEWEEMILGEITDVRDGTHSSPKYQATGYPLITSKNIKNGEVNYNDVQYISEADFIEINKRSKVDENDILMGMIGTIGNIALVLKTPNYAIKNVALIKNRNKIHQSYLFTYLLSLPILRQLEEGIDGGTQKFIALSKIRTLLVNNPCTSEQTQIGNYFKQLDDLIQQQEQKLQTVTNLKKAMLEKMFPKEGADVPEVRFKGFTGKWEECLLEHLASFSKGKGYTKNDLCESGQPILLYGRLYTKYQPAINEVDTFANIKKDTIFSKGIEVVIPASGETSEDISRASAVLKPGIILGGDLNIVYPDHRLDPVFLALCLTNGRSKRDLSKRAKGKSVVHLHNSDLKETTIVYPRKEEQQKIGTYFKNLDELIDRSQQKIEQLKHLKQALLQKMFI